MTIKPPYHFVPVPREDDGSVNCIIDRPVFHDGRQAREEELVSGEIHCTLTALTPFLPGNDRYAIQTAKEVRKSDQKGYVVPPSGWGIDSPVKSEKCVLEPLRHHDGRVLIGGGSIKGMLRHSLGALLGAPMERVAERTYSYKPNLGFPREKVKRYPRPAVIVDTNPLQIVVLPDILDVYFMNGKAFGKIKDQPGKLFPGGFITGDFTGIRVQEQERIKRILYDEKLPATHLDHIYLSYVGGMDGTGDLARKHKTVHPAGTGFIYKHVLVKKSVWDIVKEKPFPVQDWIVEHYQRTIEHLCDRETGHLSSRHALNDAEEFPSIAQSIKNNAPLKKYQLIYVELEDEGGEPVVTSMGHHFHYRWRYVDTVRTYWTGGKEWRTRAVLHPVKDESPIKTEEKHAPPQQLSGARLFFGYVVDTTNKVQEIAPGVGKGDFEKLSGRLACNIAVEATGCPKDESRFLRPRQGCVVPLKPLGMPRPSAVEHYLQQDRIKERTKDGGILITYGDLLNDDPPGELNGRKFYLHQPDAAKNFGETFMTNDCAVIESDQAALARFVLKTGAIFRFTLRFRDLRPWELGILLIVLEMRAEELKQVFPKIAAAIPGDAPLYAHKLGYGRPLGLGSVTINADKLMVFKKNELENDHLDEQRKSALSNAQNKLATMPLETVRQWLRIHQYHGRTRAAYPLHEGQIFKYHSRIRSQHAISRRVQYPGRVKRIQHEALQPLPD